MALDEPELSPRELAVRFTETRRCFVSEASVYRLLSDNGSSYISGNLAEWLEGQGMEHVRGAPYHPQTQGKIERWHQTLDLAGKLLSAGDLENQIGTFEGYYNNHRYHESIGNATPSDAYFGRHKAIIEKREKIKKLTIQSRHVNHQQKAA
jgi:putative transposase